MQEYALLSMHFTVGDSHHFFFLSLSLSPVNPTHALLMCDLVILKALFHRFIKYFISYGGLLCCVHEEMSQL